MDHGGRRDYAISKLLVRVTARLSLACRTLDSADFPVDSSGLLTPDRRTFRAALLRDV